MIVGVISDTHGLLRPEAQRALEKSDFIVHAGDVGAAGILDALATIAPVTVVRGNVDQDDWADWLPHTAVLTAGVVRLFVLHNLSELEIDPVQYNYAAVISGHSHKAAALNRDGVLYLNPGSAGPRRFQLPVTVARLHIDDLVVRHEIVEL